MLNFIMSAKKAPGKLTSFMPGRPGKISKRLSKMLKFKILKKIKGFKKVFNPKTWRKIGFLAAGIFFIVLLYFGKSLFVAAWVEGKPVYRLSLVRELEKQDGGQVLDNLIEQSLILQAAQKAKINIDDKTIQEVIAGIENNYQRQGSSLDEVLQFRNQTRTDLYEQIKLQKIVEQILAPSLKVTPEEISAYFNKYRASFPAKTTFDQVKSQIENVLLDQKLTDAYEKWMADLKTKAKIFRFVKF